MAAQLMSDPNRFRGTCRIYGDLAWLLRQQIHMLPLGTHSANGIQYIAEPISKNRWRRESGGRWSVEREFTT